MSAASFLNKIAKTTSGYMNFDSLKLKKPYKVYKFSILESKAFDKERTCVRVHIKGGYLILPERFDGCYDHLQTLNLDNLYIVYNGRKGKMLDINFKEYDEDSMDDGESDDGDDSDYDDDDDGKAKKTNNKKKSNNNIKKNNNKKNVNKNNNKKNKN